MLARDPNRGVRGKFLFRFSCICSSSPERRHSSWLFWTKSERRWARYLFESGDVSWFCISWCSSMMMLYWALSNSGKNALSLTYLFLCFPYLLLVLTCPLRFTYDLVDRLDIRGKAYSLSCPGIDYVMNLPINKLWILRISTVFGSVGVNSFSSCSSYLEDIS